MRCIKITLTGAAQQITTDAKLYASILVIQANGAAGVWVGDNTVATGNGIYLAPAASPPGGGSVTLQIYAPHGAHLIDYYVIGTATQIVNVLYENAQ